jgi:hypothetical protein
VLKDYNRHYDIGPGKVGQLGAKVGKAQEKRKEAEKARKDFEKTNKEYIALDKAERKANSEYYALTDELYKRSRECKQRIMIDGVTPATIAMVDKLVKYYQ